MPRSRVRCSPTRSRSRCWSPRPVRSPAASGRRCSRRRATNQCVRSRQPPENVGEALRGEPARRIPRAHVGPGAGWCCPDGRARTQAFEPAASRDSMTEFSRHTPDRTAPDALHSASKQAHLRCQGCRRTGPYVLTFETQIRHKSSGPRRRISTGPDFSGLYRMSEYAASPPLGDPERIVADQLSGTARDSRTLRRTVPSSYRSVARRPYQHPR